MVEIVLSIFIIHLKNGNLSGVTTLSILVITTGFLPNSESPKPSKYFDFRTEQFFFLLKTIIAHVDRVQCSFPLVKEYL